MSLESLIYDTIYSYVDSTQIDKKRCDDLHAELAFLQPGIPKDGVHGYIAFNVVDKPRMKLRTARFLTRKLSLNSGFLSDDVIQQIAEKINLVLFQSVLSVELICGPAITKAYENAVGNNSCMTRACSEYTLLYEMNPDRFQMLIMRQFNTSARAIVHKLDNGDYYLDRIYSDSQTLVKAMCEYAKKQGWHYKNTHCLPSCDEHILKVSDLDWEDGHVPYQDTMIYGEITSENKLTISACDGDLELRSVNGYIVSETCVCCGEHLNEDNLFIEPDGNEHYCESCFCEHFTTCDFCGETVDNDDTVCLESEGVAYCDSCISEHTWHCNNCGSYFSNDIESISVRGDNVVCKNCADDYNYCERCGEYYKGDTFETKNHKIICKTCSEDYPGQLCLPNT
jgi:hypothetical protein